MEEDDDFSPEPDDKGLINISNRAWSNIDPQIWTMSIRILKLDISYNHFTEIPHQIGELIMLRELIGSFNKIVNISPEVGKLKRLRRLILNNNRIKTIPSEVGNLENLEEVVFSENSIEEIPSTMAKMVNLKILRLSNNKLRVIPYEIADILTLETLEAANNPHLDMIPSKWRGDTESIIFTCRVHRDYNIKMTEIVQSNVDLTKHSQVTEQENLHIKEQLNELSAKMEELKKNIPKKIMKKLEKAEVLAASQQSMLIDPEAKDKNKNSCIIN